MSPGKKASLTALVNSKTFMDTEEYVLNLRGTWNLRTRDEPWYPLYENWYNSIVPAFTKCQQFGNPTTIVVV